MSFRYIVATRFLYADHDKVAREVAEAFGAEILIKEPAVVGRFSSVDDASVFSWINDAQVSEAFVVLCEDGEVLARCGSHRGRFSGPGAVRIFGEREDA